MSKFFRFEDQHEQLQDICDAACRDCDWYGMQDDCELCDDTRILHCPECDIAYDDPVPNLFSFNSPIGACPTCRGFGRTIEIDPALVVPDLSLIHI